MPKKSSARSPSITSQESYKAVIIADLVAEVEEEVEVENETSIEDPSPVVLNLDEKGSPINGTDISKGIILNATNFPSPDPKSNGLPASNFSQQQTAKKEKDTSFKAEFSQMSALRKIAFGFSFLPSILFVLCFAIIFPCQKTFPCMEERWTITLNHTEVTSRLEVPSSIVFTFKNEKKSGIRSLDDALGETLWQKELSSPASFLECGHLANLEGQTCLVLEDSGKLHLFDAIKGNHLWELSLNKGDTLPTILPDCNNDGVDEIAVVTPKKEIKIIHLGNIIFLIEIPGCSSIPSHLITWKRHNGTDLILICQNEDKEILMKVPQNKWCPYDNAHNETIKTFLSAENGTLSEAKFLPLADNFIIWTEQESLLLSKDGLNQWTVPTTNHSTQNRFLMSGKFNNAPQVILYSSNIRDGLQITLLDLESGNVTLSKTIPTLEITEVAKLTGEKEDYLVGLQKKLSKGRKSQQINELSASFFQILTNEKVELNSTFPIDEEVALMTLDGKNLHTIQSQTLNYLEGEQYKTAFTVVLKENNKILELFLLRKPRDNRIEKLTTLKSITFSNWDQSSSEAPQCAWK